MARLGLHTRLDQQPLRGKEEGPEPRWLPQGGPARSREVGGFAGAAAVNILIRTGEQMVRAAGLGGKQGTHGHSLAAPLRCPLYTPLGEGCVSYLLGALHLLHHLSGDSSLAGRGARAGL